MQANRGDTYGRLKKKLKKDGENNNKSKTIYHKINNGVSSAIDGIDKIEKSLDQVTTMAHSFDVVIATEVLAKSDKRKIRLVTLGGPLKIATACAPRVQTAIDRINDECHFMYFKNEEIMHFLVTGKI